MAHMACLHVRPTQRASSTVSQAHVRTSLLSSGNHLFFEEKKGFIDLIDYSADTVHS
jgi:hypothetical protein